MICPNCMHDTEVAYGAMTGSLVCLTPGCTWERPLSEDEAFELFFGNRKPRLRYGPVEESAAETEALIHS